MTNNLKSGERLDDLQLMGFRLSRIRNDFVLGLMRWCFLILPRSNRGRRFWIWEPEPGSYRFYCLQRPGESILSDLRFKKESADMGAKKYRVESSAGKNWDCAGRYQRGGSVIQADFFLMWSWPIHRICWISMVCRIREMPKRSHGMRFYVLWMIFTREQTITCGRERAVLYDT